MMIMSSAAIWPSLEEAVSDGSRVNTCCGFSRQPPGGNGPFLSNGMPQSMILPVLISLAALTSFSGVMKFSVPIWSSAPQRPQLDSSLPSSWCGQTVASVSLICCVPFLTSLRLYGWDRWVGKKPA